MRFAFSLALLVGLACASQAPGYPITLANTGVTAANNANGTNSNIQGTGGATDLNYTVEVPGGTSFQPALVVTDQGAYFRPGNSQYINDTGSGNNNEPVGNYDYRTTFSLPSWAPLSSATLSGTLYVDDAISDVLVNGMSTGIHGGGFGSGSGLAFTIPAGFSGFQSGANTLDFIVNNGGSSPNPTAFDATLLRGTFTPEPSSIILCGLGAIGLIIAARRRKA
jgi:hypothetical protein